MSSEEEIVVMVLHADKETWEQEIVTPDDFEKLQETGDAITLDQFDRLVNQLSEIDEVTWEEVEKYGFKETAITVEDAREAAKKEVV